MLNHRPFPFISGPGGVGLSKMPEIALFLYCSKHKGST